jgi:hypothetical protein
MMVKSRLEKNILNSPHAKRWFFLYTKFVILGILWSKGKIVSDMKNFKIFFSWPLFTIILRLKIIFLGTNSILRVKTMYESVNQSKNNNPSLSGFSSHFDFRLMPYVIRYFLLQTTVWNKCAVSRKCNAFWLLFTQRLTHRLRTHDS